MFSSILRIIQMSPNSNNAEKAMDGDNTGIAIAPG